MQSEHKSDSTCMKCFSCEHVSSEAQSIVQSASANTRQRSWVRLGTQAASKQRELG